MNDEKWLGKVHSYGIEEDERFCNVMASILCVKREHCSLSSCVGEVHSKIRGKSLGWQMFINLNWLN
jgi:hypothetical protein